MKNESIQQMENEFKEKMEELRGKFDEEKTKK